MDHPQFQNITYRYFRGQLSDDEYELLIDCLQDPINQEYFDHEKQAWNENPELDEEGKKNWRGLKYKINLLGSDSAKTPITRRLWVKVASVAAILMLGVLCGGSLTHFFLGHKMNQDQLVFETPRGEKSMVVLPDGTEVWLNANSRLIYKSFSANLRQVEFKGEAFFKVAHNEHVPFVVRTNECDIKVLGTTFNVMAYDEFGRKEITLLNGKVNVISENSDQVLKPGQALVLKDNQVQISEVNASQASAWVDNKFNFSNIPLSELIQRLENWYDVDITLENNTGREVNFTGTFKNEETIWQVLDAIKIYTPIAYKKSDLRKITIRII